MKQSDIDCWLYTCGLLEKLNCPQNQQESQDVPPQDHPGGADGLSQDLPSNFKKISEFSLRVQCLNITMRMSSETSLQIVGHISASTAGAYLWREDETLAG